MKSLILLIFILFSGFSMISQNLESEMLYPDTLKCNVDSFYLRSQKTDGIWAHAISKDKIYNLGTYGYEGVSWTIWTDKDTMEIPYVNFPFGQKIKIPIMSPTDTINCILRFQPSYSVYSEKYISTARGIVKVEIPKMYELANIILYLSKCSEKTRNHPNTEYSKRVLDYFAPFKNHKLIQVLNKNCSDENCFDTYYGFRENSICFKFNDNFIDYDTYYKHVFNDNSEIRGGFFRNILYLVQDFAVKSNYTKFHQDNFEYYQNLIERQSNLLPIMQMWQWLEIEFTQRMDSYKIIFSPLIGGSHSTQRYNKGFWAEPEFEECIMFINSTENIDTNKDYSEQLKEGLMSGIVFTEINHNYVNPASEKNIKAIKDLISDKDFWATKKAQKNYSSEFSIFNEYMTHSVFCLYVEDIYKGKVQEEIIEQRIKLMESRGFPKFRQFNKKLQLLMKNRNKTINEYYTEIIENMNSIKQ